MDYQIAKRLKDCGLKQGLITTLFCIEHKRARIICDTHCDGKTESLYIPTLEEVIEALPKQIGDNIFDLCWLYGEWCASYEAPNMKILPKNEQKEAFGPTSLLAASKLYLAIHEK